MRPKVVPIGIGGDSPSNDARMVIEASRPYAASVTLRGVADLLFHRWSVEGVDEKAKAAKGSSARKTDNLETYVYRCDNGNLGIPGEWLRMALVNTAKYRQDPRSPRKSAMDLFKAGLVCTPVIADLGFDKWDYEDRRRVNIQRNAINRNRPALKTGWKIDFEIEVILPEYIHPDLLQGVLVDAGRLNGLGDFRPTFGRFHVEKFQT